VSSRESDSIASFPQFGAGLLDLSKWILDLLPVPVYATDTEGHITFYNQAAVELWGRHPQIGRTTWCGSWQLYQVDGQPLPQDECPMAMALKERCPVKGAEAVAERPDGTRVRFRAYTSHLLDESGAIVGALNTLIDVTEQERAEEIRQRLVSIVESSQDAIVAKDLNGIITNWNHGAQQLFGYTAEEVIGKPVTVLIPHDHLNEEPEILNRIRRGEKVDHYETIRRRKDGSLVEISLMVSPVKDAEGRIVGASKIARDITERRRAEEQRQLLLREMNHRVKNLFSLASGVVTLSARSAETPDGLATAVRERLTALARAHDLTLPDLSKGALKAQSATSLRSLVATIVSPFEETAPSASRVAVNGPDVAVGGSAITGMALLLHEFATNAAKYGAFSVPSGHVKIDWSVEKDMLLFKWEEEDGPPLEPPGEEAGGFGTLLARRIVGGQLHGRISHIWKRSGLIINLSLPLAVLSD
jgi:PAS domain S-box-containing protein